MDVEDGCPSGCASETSSRPRAVDRSTGGEHRRPDEASPGESPDRQVQRHDHRVELRPDVHGADEQLDRVQPHRRAREPGRDLQIRLPPHDRDRHVDDHDRNQEGQCAVCVVDGVSFVERVGHDPSVHERPPGHVAELAGVRTDE